MLTGFMQEHQKPRLLDSNRIPCLSDKRGIRQCGFLINPFAHSMRWGRACGRSAYPKCIAARW